MCKILPLLIIMLLSPLVKAEHSIHLIAGLNSQTFGFEFEAQVKNLLLVYSNSGKIWGTDAFDPYLGRNRAEYDGKLLFSIEGGFQKNITNIFYLTPVIGAYIDLIINGDFHYERTALYHVDFGPQISVKLSKKINAIIFSYKILMKPIRLSGSNSYNFAFSSELLNIVQVGINIPVRQN